MTNFVSYIFTLAIVVTPMTGGVAQAQTTQRDYTKPATITRQIGDPVMVPIVVALRPASAKVTTWIMQFNGTVVAPQLPGGQVSVPGGTITAALTGTAGEVAITFDGTLPDTNAVVYKVAFKCIGAGSAQFPFKDITCKDASGVSINVTGKTLDRLIVPDSGAFVSAIE